MSTWKFIGIERDPPARWPFQHSFTRWRIPGVTRGAIGSHGSGHAKFLGACLSWLDNSSHGYANEVTLDLWGLVRIRYEPRSKLKQFRVGARVQFASLQWPIRRVV